jgi:hypothetical protein
MEWGKGIHGQRINTERFAGHLRLRLQQTTNQSPVLRARHGVPLSLARDCRFWPMHPPRQYPLTRPQQIAKTRLRVARLTGEWRS